MSSIVQEFWLNFTRNLIQPLLLFFYMGFLVPVLGVKLEFPQQLYQGLTIFLLIAIGWKGGEELSHLTTNELGHAGGFMAVGLVTNFVIGIIAYFVLRTVTKLRKVDAATIAGYYGSDSAGTFATAVGVLLSAKVAFASFMPVMLAVMEIPGCLLALFLVSSLRQKGMDTLGNMPDEPGYDPRRRPLVLTMDPDQAPEVSPGRVGPSQLDGRAEVAVTTLAAKSGSLRAELLREIFLNPGIYLLVAGILVGFLSGKQGTAVTKDNDLLFISLFPSFLCIFLLAMGMTASSKLNDLKIAGWPFIAYGLIAPNVFATMGIVVAHAYSMATHEPLALGTYVLFSVLCGAGSYIAMPAVQRLAIPEASPTLPLAASLGLTFSYNVTIGIPIYVMISQFSIKLVPVR